MRRKILISVLAIFVVTQFSFAASTKISKDAIIINGQSGNLTFNIKNADIRSVLQIFAKQLGINIVSSNDVAGNVTFSFTNVDPREGLEAVLKAKGYDWFQEGDTLVVSTKDTVRTYLLEYSNAVEVKAALDNIAEKSDSISVNESYNALIVRTSTKNIGRIEKAIKDLDVPPTQVVVEAKIIEIRDNDNGSVGLDIKGTQAGNVNNFAETLNLAGRPTDTSAKGFYAEVFKGNVEAYLSALLTKSNYNLVAAPRITTINHKQATILIGSKLGYRSAVITQTGTVYQVNFLTTGTNLTLTPHVGEGGYIRMTILPKVSDGSVTDDLPTENTTETFNEVLVKDGQTVVIGGLIKTVENQVDSGVPFLMQVPILGSFFRKTTIQNEKRELMIFVTPHILTPEYLTQMDNERTKTLDTAVNRKSTLIH